MRGFTKNHEYSIRCNLYDRAGQVASKIMMKMSEKYKINLQDYVLVADMNGQMVVIDDDEPILNCQPK